MVFGLGVAKNEETVLANFMIQSGHNVDGSTGALRRGDMGAGRGGTQL